MSGEPVPWVCSRHWGKLKETCASGWWGFVSLVPVCVPVMLDVEKDIVLSILVLSMSEVQCSWLCPITGSQPSSLILWSCDPGRFRVPLILGLLEHLGFGLPLGAEPKPKVSSGYRFRWEGNCAPVWEGIPAFLYSGGPSYSRCWGSFCGLLSSDPECDTWVTVFL